MQLTKMEGEKFSQLRKIRISRAERSHCLSISPNVSLTNSGTDCSGFRVRLGTNFVISTSWIFGHEASQISTVKDDRRGLRAQLGALEERHQVHGSQRRRRDVARRRGVGRAAVAGFETQCSNIKNLVLILAILVALLGLVHCLT